MKGQGEKKEFSWLKSYMQENLWFLTLWRTLQLPSYRVHREQKHFQALRSELFRLAEEESIAWASFIILSLVQSFIAEKRVSVPALQSPPQVKDS